MSAEPVPIPPPNNDLGSSLLSSSSDPSSLPVWNRLTVWASENKAVIYTIAGVAVVVSGAGVAYYLSDSRKRATLAEDKKRPSKKERRKAKQEREKEQSEAKAVPEQSETSRLSRILLSCVIYSFDISPASSTNRRAGSIRWYPTD